MTKNSPRRNSNAQGLLLIPMQWTIVYFGHSVIAVDTVSEFTQYMKKDRICINGQVLKVQ